MIADPDWFKPGGKTVGGYVHPDYVGRVLVGVRIEIPELSGEEYSRFVKHAFFRVYEHGELVADIPMKQIMAFSGGFRFGKPLVLTGHSKVVVEISDKIMPELPQNVLLVPIFKEGAP